MYRFSSAVIHFYEYCKTPSLSNKHLKSTGVLDVVPVEKT
jgi:hypothetical protein